MNAMVSIPYRTVIGRIVVLHAVLYSVHSKVFRAPLVLTLETFKIPVFAQFARSRLLFFALIYGSISEFA